MFGRRKRQRAQDVSSVEADFDHEPEFDDDPAFADDQAPFGGGGVGGGGRHAANPAFAGDFETGGGFAGDGLPGGDPPNGASGLAPAAGAGRLGPANVLHVQRGRHAGQSADESGPWDSTDQYSELVRADLGSLYVPVGPDYQMQLVFAEQQAAWVSIHHAGSDLQLMAFAAPRTSSLWDEVRVEIAGEINSSGGSAHEQDGPFGRELIAQVPVQPASPERVTLRFVGVDGPRWFLRGLFSGPAATSPSDAMPLENLFREVVVVRGEHPVPPREPLELRLPPEAQQQLAEQQAAMAEAQAAQAGGAQVAGQPPFPGQPVPGQPSHASPPMPDQRFPGQPPFVG